MVNLWLFSIVCASCFFEGNKIINIIKYKVLTKYFACTCGNIFLQMLITQKFKIRVFLTVFRANFWKKAWVIHVVQGIFHKLADFFKWP